SSIPHWVVLHLIASKILTTTQARGALLDLLDSHLKTVPEETHAPYLILAAYHLSRFTLLIPLRLIIERFLTTPVASALPEDIPIDPLASNPNLRPPPPPALSFNLLLQALSTNPVRSVESANNVVALLKSMDSRQLHLASSTYLHLLSDRFVNLQLTKYLQERMVHERVVPTVEHLEAFLRIFAREGAIHDAKKYLDIIHAVGKGTTQEGENDPRLPSRTEAAPSSAPAQQVKLSYKPYRDIYDLTAALHVAAKDLSTPTHRLIGLFMDIQKRAATNDSSTDPSNKPTVATYTVLIRGLLLRRQYGKAVQYWERFLKTKLEVDEQILAAGIVALIRAGKHDVAFQTLEKFCGPEGETQVESLLGSSGDSKLEDSTQPRQPHIQPSIHLINVFLAALLRVSRSDVVFRLWTHMEVLYGVLPNAQTLSVLLQAARRGEGLDRHPSKGSLRQYTHSMYHHQYTLPSPWQAREASKGTAIPSSPSLISPLAFTRKIFHQVLFANDYSRVLPSVTAPASYLRATYDADGTSAGSSASSSTLTQALSSLLPLPTPFRPKRWDPEESMTRDIWTESGEAWFPSLVLTNANFLNYISLVGLCGDGDAGIPLVLARMRALGIQPSEATLALSLVLWGEISVGAPLVERFGSDGGAEYRRLVDWLRDWVGEDRLPHWRTLRKWQRIVGEMR
ncbi:hypothetical protein BJ165DRAFT_1310568, partial [Panaeolus papilionaceus]